MIKTYTFPLVAHESFFKDFVPPFCFFSYRRLTRTYVCDLVILITAHSSKVQL